MSLSALWLNNRVIVNKSYNRLWASVPHLKVEGLNEAQADILQCKDSEHHWLDLVTVPLRAKRSFF